MKKLQILFILITFAYSSFAQRKIEPCAFDYYTNNTSILKAETLIKNALLLNRAASDSIKTIPVVVHVIHNGGNENISNSQIQSAIDVLNEDYGKLIGTPGFGNGVDTKVRFCLAKISPSGNCTNGIVRIKSTLTNHKTFERAKLKELSFWDNKKYLNMYIVKTISGSVLGYSSFPGGPADEDGIVVRHNVFGRVGTAAASMGRTTSHELGHWFGLYHVFNNGCGTDLCNDGDYVCDTPPQDTPSFDCNTKNTCFNDLPDVNDQKENYMSYTNDACKSMFTAGQRDRIQATLQTLRPEIWNATNLINTGCDSNYTAPVNCTVSADLVTLTRDICIGNSVSFMDKSLNNATAWQWIFYGGTPVSSTNQNPTVIYDSIGVFTVQLIVWDSVTSDTISFANYITVSLPSNGDSLSFGQNFDTGLYPPTSLTINNLDGGITWELDSSTSVSKNYSIKINNLINTNYGSIDELILPPFDFTTTNPDSIIRMTFNWAYARSDASFSDDLYVLLSTDCGVNFTQVFYKTGNNLATAPTQTTPFVPDSSQWKNAYIYLNTFATETNVMLKIVNVTDGGNNLYLDNIYVGDGSQARPLPLSSFTNKLTANNSFRMFPNPTSNKVTILSTNVIKNIKIYNLTGQIIMNDNVPQSSTTTLSTSNLNSGIYYVVVEEKNGKRQTKKLIIHKTN